MKKYVAILLALVCILSGCGGVPAETAPTTTVPATEPAPQPAGTLYVAFGAVLEMVYDSDGNALSITGVNEDGKNLAAAHQDQLNKGCVYALRAILRYAITEELLKDAKTVTVRIGADDPLPCEDFLFTIGQDCQYLIDEEVAGIDMYCLTDDCLDETGNVTSGIAAKLAATYLGVEETALTGGETSVDGLYTFSAGENACTVDAFTGLVAAA